jgi:hypothetical protein
MEKQIFRKGNTEEYTYKVSLEDFSLYSAISLAIPYIFSLIGTQLMDFFSSFHIRKNEKEIQYLLYCKCR